MLLNSEDLKKYLKGVLDIELSLYLQKETLLRMTNTYNSLGKSTIFSEIKEEKSSVSIVEIMECTGFLIGGIVAIIVFIVCIVHEGLLGFFVGIIGALLYGILAFIAGGIIIGGIIGLILKSKDQARLTHDFNEEIIYRQVQIMNDEDRVKNEERKKAILLRDINSVKTQIRKTETSLVKAYRYNVLDPDYRNIYAVSSMYGYLVKGRTKCLQFNDATGDQGAYNIYENELRLNKIITNTQEILNKLDQVINAQYQLAYGLQQANRKIDALCHSISNHINKVETSLQNIEQCQQLIAYNTEQTRYEIAFLGWINLLN